MCIRDSFRRLEQRAGDGFKTHVGKGRRDYICPAIMAVLPHLCDKQSGLSAQSATDGIDAIHHKSITGIVRISLAVNPRYRSRRRGVTTESRFQRVGNLAKRCPRACRANC